MKAMAPHSSTLACKIPWTEEPGRLHSVGSWRVGHDWATSLSLFSFMHWRRKWQPTPVFLPGESQGRGSLVGCVYGVAQIRTWLKQLSSSSVAMKRREAKSKGEKERYKHLNAEFQRIARRDKKAFLRDKCKEREENNRFGKNRDLFKKIRDTKGTFHAKMGSIKDRNGMDPPDRKSVV